MELPKIIKKLCLHFIHLKLSSHKMIKLSKNYTNSSTKEYSKGFFYTENIQLQNI